MLHRTAGRDGQHLGDRPGWWDRDNPPGWFRGLLVAGAVTSVALIQPILLLVFYAPTSPLALPATFESLQLASGAATAATVLLLGLVLLAVRRAAPPPEPIPRMAAEAKGLMELKELLTGVATQASTLRLRVEGDAQLDRILASLEDAAERGSYVARHILASEPIATLTHRAAGDLGWGPHDHAGACRNVLVVDEDPATRRLFRQLLTPLGFLVLAVPGGELAIDAYESYSGDIAAVFVAWDHGALEGPDVIATLRRLDPELPIFVLSTLEIDDGEIAPLLRGPGGVVRKPVSEREIVDSIRRFSRTPRTSRD